jgi:hypothetical protein
MLAHFRGMNFVEQLRRHIGFLESSSRAFDTGHTEEALRMAVSLRVLFHDTSKSTSLLTHLGIKDTSKVLSTFKPIKQEPGLLVASVPFWLNWTGERQAPLGDSDCKECMPVSQWWTQLVMTGNSDLARKDIILAAANQDGGAHVDANPGKEAQELIRGVGTHTIRIGGVELKTVLDNHHFYLLRQFAYEVLNSPDVNSTQTV